MEWLCGILGAVCLIYFLILASVGMDASWIWLAAALAFGAASGGRIFMKVHGMAWHKGVKWSLICLAGAGMLVFFVLEACVIGGMRAKPAGRLDYLIVLGAQVRGETPSKALALRLDMAESVWRECGEPMLLLSGGKGADEQISEAECMRRVLVKRGIPEEKMILEDRSVNTFENLQFCAELSDCKTKRTGIVTNNFHVYRALCLAAKQGYEDICGAAAKTDWRFQAHYMVREALAVLKEKLVGNIA